jgi:hypothetical protein
LEKYPNKQAAEKIVIIDEIIDGLKEYRMGIHYKVEQSYFMKNLSQKEQHLIK